MTLTAQDGRDYYYSKKYLDLNIRFLNKYSKRIERQQKQLLRKLKRGEDKLASELRKNDSAAFVQFREQALSYDSITRISKFDTAGSTSNNIRSGNKVFDSLRKVQNFLQDVTQSPNNYSTDISALQQKLAHQQYINALVEQRTVSLKGLSANTRFPALKLIEKDLFYSKSRMAAWKKVADEPSVAEGKALEYLQGTKGFSFAEEKTGMQAASNEADLEKMGFHTKRQLNQQLQKQFGDNLGNMQQQVGKQVNDWQQQSQQLAGAVKKTQQQVNTTREDIAATKKSVKQLTKTKPLDFKVNPMRGLPFWKRVGKGFSFNTFRATPDGKRPAILDLAGTAAFRHTPRLSYGLGAGISIGLGQNWSNIRFSYEGASLRAFAIYEAIFSIAAYAGYERFFKYTLSNGQSIRNEQAGLNSHNTSSYSEAALIGLSKSYKISSQWDGQIQLLYDVWWREKGLNTPVIIRIANTRK